MVPRRVTKPMIRDGLERVADGTHTLASLSRSWGRAANYLQNRAAKDEEIREWMDKAMLSRWDEQAHRSRMTAQLGVERVLDHFIELDEANRDRRAKGEPEELVSASDLDRLARALVNFQEAADRSVAQARTRELERAGRGGDSAGELFAAMAARWGPAAAPALGEGETA